MLYFLQVEQLLRAIHVVNSGAGVGAFVIIAECGSKEIGLYAGLLEQHDFEIEFFTGSKWLVVTAKVCLTEFSY